MSSSTSKLLVLVAPLLFGLFAGCFGGDDEIDFDFEPGTNFKPTGKEVKIRMWVEDVTQKEIWPGFFVNMWAFCAEPTDPSDEYSAAAIEYWDEGSKCSIPGPTLRVQQGDRVIVDFSNPHFHPHTIHWHGQYVPNHSDGVQGVTQDSVESGKSYTYDFIAAREGTLWYHCHVDTPFHIMMGLYGMMIVEPQDTTWEPEDIDREFNWILSTAIEKHVAYVPPLPGQVIDPHANHKHGVCGGASGFVGCQNPPVPEPLDIFLLNGVSFPNTVKRDDTLLVIKPDERVRVRLLNAGGTFETWHTHGHDMYVTHKDGAPLHPNARFWTDTLAIGPGERYDFVLEGRQNNEGVWVAHTHVEEHITNSHQAPGGMLTSIAYEGFEDDLRPFKSELPGGKTTEVPREVPADFALQNLTYLQSNNDVTMTIPVNDTCFVDVVRLAVRYHADERSNIAPGTANEIVARFRDPEGTVVFAHTFTRDAPAVTWYPTVAQLVSGAYTLRITGPSSANAAIQIDAFVDNFDSIEEARAAGNPCS